ncbi:MAG TPA: TIGR03084 family metal-binding protein [Acidimicrobiales bacterium]|nr:TIGR03084 family metal-binding protein [Acidimicrobiales bacterium]
MPTIEDLCRDLADEQRSLDRVLTPLPAADWSRPTPAAGWDVRDSLSHLCFFEEAAALSVRHPAAFEEHRRRLLDGMAAAASAGRDTPDVALGRQIGDPADLLGRWRQAGADYRQAVTGADRQARESGQKLRIAWYGPDMSPASFTTARLMETWAHGVDILDALGLPLEATSRLRHVCHIGYGARGYSFAAHGQQDPGDPVRLEVRGPGGETWAWGPEDAVDRISGPALDVALVFAQRRHRSRTAVEVTGPVAERWMAIAQAFAGPPTVTAADR